MSVPERIGELVSRLRASVGKAVFEDATGLANPPPPRETWIDLQGEAVTVAADADHAGRRDLALALLEAIVERPSYGPSNPLSPDAFSLILDAAPAELAASLDQSVGHLYGGKRYVRRHIWAIPGREGARWLGTLARADDARANFLLQDMRVGTAPGWREEDWADRLDTMAELPAEPRPGVLMMLFARPRHRLHRERRPGGVHGARRRADLVVG